MLDMEAIKNFSIDKSDWQKVKLGDVVFEPKESVKDPIAEGIQNVVGLEHITSEDIHLRRSASMEESTTFTKKFSKGDVLFGRRRAYLKKAAKADFEGICSGDITVMRANDELLLPELLPFIVNNDKFFEYAITHSVGGLSPRVKFKDLAKYEFLLPRTDKQKEISELLCSLDGALQKSKKLKEQCFQYVSSLSHIALSSGIDDKGKPFNWSNDELQKSKIGLIPPNWSAEPIKFFGVNKGVVNGPFGSDLLTSELQEEGVPVIYIRDIKPGKYNRISTAFVTQKKAKQLSFCSVISGDIVISKLGVPPCDAALYLEQEAGIVTQDVIRLRPKDGVNTRYLVGLLNSSYGRSLIERITVGGGRKRVSLTHFKKLLIPNPPSIQQKRIGDFLLEQDVLYSQVCEQVTSIRSLQNLLISRVF